MVSGYPNRLILSDFCRTAPINPHLSESTGLFLKDTQLLKACLLEALRICRDAFQKHPTTREISRDEISRWRIWAMDQVKSFQRASSALEGRNGYLSQMHHNHRGLPRRRYKIWTVIHNFDCRASDGTTPASRFFQHSFPDFFETLLSKIDQLPLPRSRRQPTRLLA